MAVARSKNQAVEMEKNIKEEQGYPKPKITKYREAANGGR